VRVVQFPWLLQAIHASFFHVSACSGCIGAWQRSLVTLMDAAGMSDAQQALLQQYLFDHQQQQQLLQLDGGPNGAEGAPLDILAAAAGMGPNSGGFLGLSGSDMGPGGYDPLMGGSPAFTDEDKALMRAGAGPKPNNHLYKVGHTWVEQAGLCMRGL
jgi:hypothetical protein